MFTSVQYTTFLYHYFKEWRQNPHWSLLCCLGLLLPLNDLQGELRGLAEADIFKNQIQTGQIDKPTVLSAVKDSGAIDVTLDVDEQGDGNRLDKRDESYQHTENSDTTRHKGTQTELSYISIAEVLAQTLLIESHEEFLLVKASRTTCSNVQCQ